MDVDVGQRDPRQDGLGRLGLSSRGAPTLSRRGDAQQTRKCIPPEIRPFPMRAVGFSDASEWARAWAIHTPSGMFAVSLNERPDKSIFHWELLAMIEGQGALIDLAPPESSFLGSKNKMYEA